MPMLDRATSVAGLVEGVLDQVPGTAAPMWLSTLARMRAGAVWSPRVPTSRLQILPDLRSHGIGAQVIRTWSARP